MTRGRAAALAAVLMVAVLVLGACDTSDSGTEQADRVSAAAIKAAAVRNRVVVAQRQRRTAVRRRARAARLRRAHTTPTTIVTQASTSFVSDVAAIQKTVDALNAAFVTSVASGITNSTGANNWVGKDMYSSGQCESFEQSLGQGIVSEHIVMYPNTFTAAPGWVDPVIGRVPQGRIYQVGIDEIQTLVPTGAQRAIRQWIHVAVGPDGRGRLFLRCH
jgi:hypothetical protein